MRLPTPARPPRRQSARFSISRACLFLVLITIGGACNPSEKPTEPGPGPSGAAASPTQSSHALLYLDRERLVAWDFETENIHMLAELPSADVALSPDTLRYVVVEETSPLGPGPEGFREPRLVLGTTTGESSEPLGPGRSPLWSPDGSLVAAITASTSPGDCPDIETEGGGCPTEQVVVYDPNSPGAAEIVSDPAAGYALLGWAGDSVLSLRPPGEAVLGDRPLPNPPSELWGVSPQGNDILTVDDTGPSFSSIDAEAPHASIAIDGRLGDGSWSPNGEWVGAVVLKPDGAKLSTTLVLIDAHTGAVMNVSDGEGAQGQVVWRNDSAIFAFARVSPLHPRKLQAVECTIELECRALFSWVEGITILGLR